jgi:AcrR family transcriptional regulator
MNNNKPIWIYAGYSLLAEEGPVSIQIEKLARITGMNKSGFYHHFGDRDVFFDELMRHHMKLMEKFNNEASGLERFDPDYFRLLSEYKDPLFVNVQMTRWQEIPYFTESVKRSRKENEKNILPLWASYINLNDNYDLASEIWNVTRDAVYERLNYSKTSAESIRTLIIEVAGTFGKLKKCSERSLKQTALIHN